MPLDFAVSEKERGRGTRDSYQEFMNMKKDPSTCSHATNPPSGMVVLYAGGGVGSAGRDSAELEAMPDDPVSTFSPPIPSPLLLLSWEQLFGIILSCKDSFDPVKLPCSSFSWAISVQKWGVQ